MNDSDYKDEKGRFKQGNPGGPGRPKKALEVAYQLTFNEVITLDKWKKVIEGRLFDALGKKVIIDDGIPKLVDDPDSTPTSRLNSSAWIGYYVIGKPTERILLEEPDPLSDMSQLTDEQIKQVLAYGRYIQEHPELLDGDVESIDFEQLPDEGDGDRED